MLGVYCCWVHNALTFMPSRAQGRPIKLRISFSQEFENDFVDNISIVARREDTVGIEALDRLGPSVLGSHKKLSQYPKEKKVHILCCCTAVGGAE